MTTQLDIDHLHSVIEQIRDPIKKELIPRQFGMTTAYLYLMLDEVLGGDCHNNYLYICSDCGVQESKRVAQEFVDMLYYDNIERIKVLMTKTPQVQTKSGQSFRFVDIQSVMNEDFWHGTHYDRVFVDIGQDWLQSPHKEALEFEIKCRGGDWV